MSTQTTNYGLIKPQLTDTPDITAMNVNWDTIDEKLKEVADNASSAGTTSVTGAGTITVTIEDNTEYTYEAVSSLTMTGNTNTAHGIVYFGASKPTISVSGFVESSGNDITSAVANETWEFDCYKGYILWKNWGA